MWLIRQPPPDIEPVTIDLLARPVSDQAVRIGHVIFDAAQVIQECRTRGLMDVSQCMVLQLLPPFATRTHPGQ